MHKPSARNYFALFVFSFIMILSCNFETSGQGSLIKEETRSILTYPYSDPNPVPSMAINSMVSAFYPYFVFDGYTDQGIRKDWKVITLENEFINVTILPEVGGKVWGAIEKSTGREFIYQNHVLKFRAIGIRGPWTSGGIEHNFGLDLGHAPNWPENLGAGKPYEPDTRFQDYISAYCYTQLRDQKLADNYTGKIINYSQKNWGNAMDPANTFIANQVFNDLGKQKEAIFAMENWKTEWIQSVTGKFHRRSSASKVQWVLAKYHGEEEKAEILEKEIATIPTENRFRLFLKTLAIINLKKNE